ncbi:MAG TPA: hypothetical protein VES42_08405, partial [Pilimelia sp.]|nr:hypothetical protein [Pilimelia sp.]
GAPEAGEDGGSDTEGLPVSAAEGCARLFAAPWEVAAAGQPLVLGPELADHVDPARAVRLRQALGGFTGDGAAGAMAALRRATEACPRFAARLDDGTEVTVALDPATDGTSGGGPDTGGRGPGGVNGAPGGGGGQEAGAPAGGGPPAGDDAAYAVRFTAHAADGRTWTGYLAADRVGPVVSVLRHLGPAGTVDAGEMAATRDAAVAKARPLAALLGRQTAGP